MSTPGQVSRTTSPPPPPPAASSRSLYRQEVLDEDEYTAALSHIIARDFFPSLVHLDATNTYLDALRSEDSNLINASVLRLQELATPTPRQRTLPQHTPSQTPWGGTQLETPLRTPCGGRPAKRLRYDVDMTLDSFQAQYTSEDNSSFTKILDEENRQRKEKWGWAWEAQKRVEGQRDKMIEAREKILIEPAVGPGVREKFTIEAPQPAGLITDGTESTDKGLNKQHGGDGGIKAPGKELTVVDQDKEAVRGKGDDKDEQVDVMAKKKDTRTAGVDGWRFKTRNALMFPPDADSAPYNAPKPSSNTAVARGEPKAVKYSNTRLPEQDDSVTPSSRTLSAPPSPTRSRVEAAISGTPYRPRSPTTSNFSLLPAMPSPTPSELGPAAMKQLMTWGTLNATPRVLGQSDNDEAIPPSTPFQLPNLSAREVLSHRLSDGASKSLRARAALMGGQAPRTPRIKSTQSGSSNGSIGPPTWTPRRIDAAGLLTPAAKRLLDRTTSGVASSRRADAMGKTAGWEGKARATEKDLNRVRWTPSPSPVTRKRP